VLENSNVITISRYFSVVEKCHCKKKKGFIIGISYINFRKSHKISNLYHKYFRPLLDYLSLHKVINLYTIPFLLKFYNDLILFPNFSKDYLVYLVQNFSMIKKRLLNRFIQRETVIRETGCKSII